MSDGRRPRGPRSRQARRARSTLPGNSPRSVTLAIAVPLQRDDLLGLFERTCALLQDSEADILRCELTGVAADAVAVDALARLALAARRAGCEVHVQGASKELRALVSFIGLADVLRE